MLLNFLSAKRSKRTEKEEFFVPSPPYAEPVITKLPKPELSMEKERWFENVDGKSLMSASILADRDKISRNLQI